MNIHTCLMLVDPGGKSLGPDLVIQRDRATDAIPLALNWALGQQHVSRSGPVPSQDSQGPWMYFSDYNRGIAIQASQLRRNLGLSENVGYIPNEIAI